jgi:hypothetical protein
LALFFGGFRWPSIGQGGILKDKEAIMDSSIKALHKNIAEWMAGPAGAVILHLSLILAVLLLVDFSTRKEEEPTFDVHYLKVETPPLDPEPPDFLPPLDLSEALPDFHLPEVDPVDLPDPLEVVEFSQPHPAEALPDFELPRIPSVLVLREFAAGSMKDRIGDGGHERAGLLHGGDGWKGAEGSVKRALEWLRVNQNRDGSWGTSDPEAMTGLALLTYLAHGETTASETFGRTVERAIRYLVARQNEAGEFARIDTTGGTYAQAICVYAVSEAYGMTRIPALKPAMEKGVEVLIRGQQAGGGFDYRFAQGARRDTSLGGWCSQALKAAFIAGADHARLKPAMERAAADLKAAQKEDGRFFYTDRNSHSTHGMTAVAVLGMQLLGHDRDSAVRKGLAALEDARCEWKNPPAWPMYAWYYIAQTKFHQGGGSWKSWNNRFAIQFIRNQNPDGSWDSAGLSLKAGTPGRENLHRVYATTLAALTLQVYYRYLPTYQPIEEQVVDQKAGNDVTIEIL